MSDLIQSELCVNLLGWGTFLHVLNPTCLCVFVGTLEQSHASVIRVLLPSTLHLCSFGSTAISEHSSFPFTYSSIHFQLLCFKFLKCIILPSVPCLLTPSLIHVGLQTPPTDHHESQTVALEALVWRTRGNKRSLRDEPSSPTFYLPLYHPLTDRK